MFAKLSVLRQSIKIHTQQIRLNTQIIFDRKYRVETRATKPYSEALNYFLHCNYDIEINKFKNIYYKKIIDNPYDSYEKIKTRLEKNGAFEEFPEFKGSVSFLMKKIFQSDNNLIYNWFNKNNPIAMELTISDICSIHNEDYGFFTYKNTLHVIVKMLELLEIYYRSTSSQHVYYQHFRYSSLLSILTDHKNFGIPNVILIPVCFPISTTDFIKISGVPIFLLGIVDKPTLADQYYNTPLEYFFHDLQHARRIYHEMLRYYDESFRHTNYFKKRYFTHIKTHLQFYKYNTDYVNNTIMPIIKINCDDSEEDIGIKQLMNMIIFEIVHEKAWVITKKSLCRNILLKYDTYPFEKIVVDDNGLRIITDKYKDPTTLHNLYGKLKCGFFDDINNHNNNIVISKFRTVEHLTKATMLLLSKLGYDLKIDEQYIKALITDKTSNFEFEDTNFHYVDQIFEYPEETYEYDDTQLHNYDNKFNNHN